MNNRILSASTLRGMDVKNYDNENIGEIQDLMINIENGSVEYAVLSFGGFMGIGDKYFAVPVEALEHSTEGMKEEIMLDVDKQKLENAPGFDKNDWPTQAGPEFIESVYSHYGYERPERRRDFARK